MTPIILVVFAIAVVVATVQLVGVLRGDGYGHNPPPRSHRGEESLTQHERVRRLAR
ncbi:MAG: hypothetical protein QOJ72_653 [Nocardioidaceae bacterium]|jgi:hypothetical protein|nr:hypothetical protein [Nocardioidaceae bacterium]